MAILLTIHEAQDIIRDDQRLFEKTVAGLRTKKVTRSRKGIARGVLPKHKLRICP
ncbi:MAG: hypothetical protein JXA35_00365 [Deltaproteobacteria bacterium]|nr:hypothetical protein [Deltaproteobacteria bacterium]